MQLSLSPPRQLTWTIFCGWSTASPKEQCMKMTGFTAARSTFVNCNFQPTTTFLTPILPYPATTYDAVLTMMINFRDALKQKGDTYGALWADEGVYHIAKEIQLVKPDEFSNIFLGLGGFHCVGLSWCIPGIIRNICSTG